MSDHPTITWSPDEIADPVGAAWERDDRALLEQEIAEAVADCLTAADIRRLCNEVLP